MNMKKKYFLILFVSILIIVGISSYFIINKSYALEEQENQTEENNTCGNLSGNQIYKAYIKDDEGTKNFGEVAHLSLNDEANAKVYDVKLIFHYETIQENTATISLSEGIKWVSWDNNENSEQIINVKPGTNTIIGDNNGKNLYQIESPTKTFEFNSSWSCVTLNFKVSIDVPLYQQEIDNAIEVRQSGNDTPIYLTVENDFTNLILEEDYNYGENLHTLNGITENDTENYETNGRLVGVTSNDAENSKTNGKLAGITPAKNILESKSMIFDSFEVKVKTPVGVKFKEAINYFPGYMGGITDGWKCSYSGPEIDDYSICSYAGTNENGDNNQIYTFTHGRIYSKLIGINPSWNFSGAATTKINDGDVIDIHLLSANYKLYNQTDATVIEIPENTITRYIIKNNPEFEISSSSKVYGLNPKYPNDIIRLGSFDIKNIGTRTNKKVINIKFDSSKIGVTHVSLPAVLNQNIVDLKYKMVDFEGNDLCKTWCQFTKYRLLEPNAMRKNYSSNLGYVNFTNEMTGIDGYITEVEYTIGSIPASAKTSFSGGVFAYSGILLKQNNNELINEMSDINYPYIYVKDKSKYTKINNDIYPVNYISTLTIKDENLSQDAECTIGNKRIDEIGNVNCLITEGTTDVYNYYQNDGENKIYANFTGYITEKNKTAALFSKEKLNLEYYINADRGQSIVSASLLKEPVIYIKLPKGIIISDNSLEISQSYLYEPFIQKNEDLTETYKYKNTINTIIDAENYIFENMKENTDYNIYKITFNKNYTDNYIGIGYPKYNLYNKENTNMKINFNIEMSDDKSYNNYGEKYYYYDILYVTDNSISNLDNINKENLYAFYVDDPTIIDSKLKKTAPLTSAKNGTNYFEVKENVDLNATIKVKNNNKYTTLSNNEYYESERDKGTELRLEISNDSGVITNSKAVIFIPIPKAGENWNGLLKSLSNEKTYEQFEYDLFLKNKITNPNSSKYTIYYGEEVTPLSYNSLLKANIEWESEDQGIDFKNVNIVKIEINGMDIDEKINFDFELYNENVTNIEESFDNFYIAYYRAFENVNGDYNSGYALTNYMSIAIPEKQKGNLIIKYVDELGNSIKDDKITTNYDGEKYNVTPENIDNYNYKYSEGASLTGTYKGEQEQTIILHYERKTISIKTHYYIENTTTKIKEDELIRDKYQTSHIIEAPLNIEKDSIEYQLISEQSKNIILSDETKDVIFYYKIKNKKEGIVEIIYQLEDSTIINKEQITGLINSQYEVNKKDIEYYEFVSISENNKGTYKQEKQTVILTYKKIERQEKGIVEIYYILEDGTIINKEQTTGLINSEYEVNKKDIENYEFVSISENSKGTYEKDKIVVILTYKKINNNESELNDQEENRIKKYEDEEIEVPITANHLSIIIIVISTLFILVGIIYIFLIKKYKILKK